MVINNELAKKYIGKHLLVGITYLDHEQNFVERKQFHGHVVRINEDEGIVISLDGAKKEFKLPPDLNALQEAPKGEYRLRASGEIVVDPDFLSTWTLTKPKPDKNP